jgi:hypothetical protein
MAGVPERRAQPLERPRVGVVAVDVTQPSRQEVERVTVDTSTVLVNALAGARAQAVDAPRRPRDADDRQIEATPLRHLMERREEFLEREVPGDPEEHQRVRARGRHAFFSW